jgi:hypothetical protein
MNSAARTLIAIAIASAVSATAAADPALDAAWKLCKADTLKQLKAPASAKFDNLSAARVKDGRIAFYFSVDSQNSYGAMLRSYAICDVDPADHFSLFNETFVDPVMEHAGGPGKYTPPAE